MFAFTKDTLGSVRQITDAIRRTADAYNIPLIDYYAAMENAVNYGIRDDGIHPSLPPDGNPANFSEENLNYGYAIRNLLTIQALEALLRTAMY